MKLSLLLLSCLTIVSLDKSFAQSALTDTDIVASGANLELVAEGFKFTEGASVDRKGNIYFTDQPNNKIWKYDVHGKLSLFLDNAGRSNGMYIDKKGNLIACADENNQLWQISKHKKITVLANDFGGHRFNGPNDVWLAPNGDIYFTDPYYQRPYWTRTKPDLESPEVYLLSHKTHQVTSVAGNFKRPNGIVGTPDGRYLYISDIEANKTYRYSIAEDGSLGNKMLFAELGSDGMTLDNRGNLYMTLHDVTIFDMHGKKIKVITVPKQTSNVAFGGKHKDELFITASDVVYKLKMNVHGVE